MPRPKPPNPPEPSVPYTEGLNPASLAAATKVGEVRKKARARAKRKRDDDQARKESLLIKYGCPVVKGSTLSIRTQWRKFGAYIDKKLRPGSSNEYGYIFKKNLSPKTLKLLKKNGTISKKQITKKGVFIIKPEGVPAKGYRVRVNKEGTLNISYLGRQEHIIPFDKMLMARNPEEALKQIIKKGKEIAKKLKMKMRTVSFIVNGFASEIRHNLESTKLIQSFYHYALNELYSAFIENDDENEDEDDSENNAKNFCKTFALKFTFSK